MDGVYPEISLIGQYHYVWFMTVVSLAGMDDSTETWRMKPAECRQIVFVGVEKLFLLRYRLIADSEIHNVEAIILV